MPRNHVRSESSSYCVVCCEDIDIFAIGQCDHPICFVCSVRMRVLGKEKYCAVCRTDLDKVLLTKKCEKWTSLQEQIKHGSIDKESGICYADKETQNKANELLQYKCPKCQDQAPERTFFKLHNHVKREHHLYFCDICSKHLQKFTHEFKLYSRADLAKHRRVGDAGDNAYKGHPLCEFCDERFLDDEDLHRHLRKNHFWCHFCEKDGQQFYFHDYVNLRVHFRDEHYLCEEDMCKYEQYTSVFRSRIDLQAHIASKHFQKMSKAQVRQARQLEVDLVFNPPPTNPGRNITGQDYGEVRATDHKFRQNRSKARSGLNSRQEEQNTQAAIEMSLSKKEQTKQPLKETKGIEKPSCEVTHPDLPEDDFPGLNEAVSDPKGCQSNSPKASPKPSRKPEAFKKKLRGLYDQEDFPSLGNSTRAQQNGAGTKVRNTSKFSPTSTRKPESFNKKDKSLGHLKDFPSLEKTASKTQQNGTNNDVRVNHKVAQGSPKATSRIPEALKTKNKAADNVEDFLSLGKLGKPSKTQQNGVGNDARSGSQFSPKSIRNPEAFSKKKMIADNVEDFPGFEKPSKTQQNGVGTDSRSSSQFSPKSIRHPEAFSEKNTAVDNVEDFPSLGNQSKIQQNGYGTNTQSGSQTSIKASQKPEASKKKTKAVDTVEDFSSHGKPSKSKPKTPPPGFSNIVKEPAAGVAQIKPPPGLQPKIPSPSVQPVILPKEEQKVVTNSTKKDQLRNQNLIENIKALLEYDMEKFAAFKKLSGKFRQGGCSAEAYYRDCTDLFGPSLPLIFNELVTLLPDQGKQNELLKVHNDVKVLSKQNGKPTQQGSGRIVHAPNIAWGTLQSNLAPVKIEEGRQNAKNEADFPSLPPAAPRHMKPARIYKTRNNLALKSAWVRGK